MTQEGVPLWLMAGKSPAKLAETGKGCSPRYAGMPTHRINSCSISIT
jgi:hypothetical protein